VAVVAPEMPPAADPPAIVRTACPRAARGATCGFVRVPLDRRFPDGPAIRVTFERYPRRVTSRPARATVLSVEGGPGYPTRADRGLRLQLWRPISARRDLLLVDLRGTGRSGALACRAFRLHILDYLARAGRCARELGRVRDAYDTSQSVQDLEAVLRALHAGKVDLYGDSYGSYAAQAFALRYPQRLRSLVLDSTYQLPGSNPVWADLAAATRSDLRRACERRPGCPARDPVALVADFVRRVRLHPIVGTAPNGDGVRTHVVVDEEALAQTLQSGYYYQAVWRDLLAALRSAEAGDTAPLLRLVAETVTADGPGGDPAQFSEALYLAVTCHDYPQPWPSGTPVSLRAAALRATLRAYPPAAFAPFSAAAWTGTDYEGVRACLRWPSRRTADPPAPPGAAYPPVPTLVLSGDLDNITPLSDARVVASRFPRSTLVDVENSGHVTALGDQNACASPIYLRFVRTLAAGDTSCARRTPEVRVVSAFPRRLAQVPPAQRSSGDRSDVADRRLVAAAAAAVADVLQRWWVNFSGRDVGLRGGQWSYRGSDDIVFRLRRVAFVPGVPVSGTVRWSYSTGRVRGIVDARAPGGRAAHVRLAWSLQERAARARLDGSVAGRALRVYMLAP
jgi:pimeloyl-ACP methyl ester carboxylesterase